MIQYVLMLFFTVGWWHSMCVFKSTILFNLMSNIDWKCIFHLLLAFLWITTWKFFFCLPWYLLFSCNHWKGHLWLRDKKCWFRITFRSLPWVQILPWTLDSFMWGRYPVCLLNVSGSFQMPACAWNNEEGAPDIFLQQCWCDVKPNQKKKKM